MLGFRRNLQNPGYESGDVEEYSRELQSWDDELEEGAEEGDGEFEDRAEECDDELEDRDEEGDDGESSRWSTSASGSSSQSMQITGSDFALKTERGL